MRHPIEIRSPSGTASAVASTEHAASSYGLPVVVVDSEALGPADLPPGSRVGASDDEVRAALRDAGYDVA